jgi:hypothetical protein
MHAPPDKVAAEQLEARALLLAGQAGLCCNPRCATGCIYILLTLANIFPAMSAPAIHLIWRYTVPPTGHAEHSPRCTGSMMTRLLVVV